MHVKNRYILICKFSTLEIDRYWISFVLFAEFLKGNDSLKLMINKKVFFCSPKPSKQVTRRLHGYKEDPYIFMDEKDPMWDPIRFDSILKQNDRQKSLQKHIVRVISLIVYDPYQMMTSFVIGRNFYGIPEDFPRNQIMYRAENGQRRTLYFVSSAIRDLVRRNNDRFKVSPLKSLKNYCSSQGH